MAKIKQGLADPDKFFNLDGLDYKQGIWEIFYGNKELDSQGEIKKDIIRVGIRNQTDTSYILQHPIKVSEYLDDSGAAYSSLDTLILDLSVLLGFNKGGGSGSGIDIKQSVNQFNDLGAGEDVGDIAYVQNSQGTSWLPNNLGGTYYPAGWYLWDGSDWISDRNAISAQLQSNILNINDNTSDLIDLQNQKVDKQFLGWVQVSDSEYTTTNRRTIPSGVRTKLTNNADNLLDLVGMFGGSSIWNPTTNKLEPDNSGDTYDWRVQFTVDPTLNNRNLTLELDIGGSQGVIWDKTLRLARGAGVDTRITETLDIFTLGTFVTNGGDLYVTCDGEIQLYNTVFKIERKYRNG